MNYKKIAPWGIYPKMRRTKVSNKIDIKISRRSFCRQNPFSCKRIFRQKLFSLNRNGIFFFPDFQISRNYSNIISLFERSSDKSKCPTLLPSRSLLIILSLNNLSAILTSQYFLLTISIFLDKPQKYLSAMAPAPQELYRLDHYTNS